MKKVFRAIAACAMAVMLSGCMKIRVDMTVAKDGSVTQNMTFMMSESVLTLDGSDLEKAVESMKEDYIKEYPDAKVEAVTEGEGDDRFGGIKVTGLKNEEIKAVVEGNKMTLTLPLKDLVSEVDQAQELSQYGLQLKDLKEYGAEMTMSVTMPGKPETNAGTVTDKTVTVDMLELPEGVDTVTITCTLGPSLSTILLIGACVCFVIAVVMVLFKKKPAAV